MKDIDFVLSRIADLKKQNSQMLADRWRIRSIMNGGADGMYSVMAWDQGKGASSSAGQSVASKVGIDLPTVNLVASGNDRFAAQLGRPPTLKAPRASDDDTREKLNKKVHILGGWDIESRAELQYPQIGRWLPGYAFYTKVITQRKDRNGDYYPVSELRDPYDVYTGYLGAQQQPVDMMAIRRVPIYALEQAYPDRDWMMLSNMVRSKRMNGSPINDGRFTPDSNRMYSWEGAQTGIEVIEYYCQDGTHICIPEIEYRLDYIESPIGESLFAFGHRFAFDKLISHYHHSIGLMGMMAKWNILALISGEDATFRETNIFGEMVGGRYQRGRFAVNKFEQGAHVERPTDGNLQQMFQQADRLERQLRISSNYDVQQDGQSPNSFATGKGMRELQGSVQAALREYQLVVRHTEEISDSKRLKFAYEVYGKERRKYWDMYGVEKTYTAEKDIGTDHRTRRIYGAMATFDSSDTIVAGLQLMQGEVIDVETFQENIDNLLDTDLINERITVKKFEGVLLQKLMQADEMGDPAAKAAIVEIMDNPKDKTKILKKWMTPQEPAMSEEEMAFAGAPGAPAGPPPAVGTLLSQLESGGGVKSGSQTVQPLGPR
jgi:hypothetical protein